MADDRGIDIKLVAQRFTQSTEALDQLAQKLSSLTSNNESITRANQNVTQASNQIQKLLDELARLTTTMKDAGSKVEIASSTAAQFLSQTDLSSIGRGLDLILVTLNGKVSDLENQVRSLDESSHKKDLELSVVRTELDSLKAKVAAVPEKQRKKLGF
jgi:DNA repair exonuclease SbcCD ATPase subunit